MGQTKKLTSSSSSSSSRPFKDFYADWVGGLRTTLLPRLRYSISAAELPSTAIPAAKSSIILDGSGAMVSYDNLLSTHVRAVYVHFHAYFQALDATVSHDVALLLVPSWRNALEQPLLWLGDFHPAIFTNLLRSFLHHTPSSPSAQFSSSATAVNAWKNPSTLLVVRLGQIDRTLRKIVPELMHRYREAQALFLDAAVDEWAEFQETAPDRSPSAEMNPYYKPAAAKAVEEIVCVFLEANRLRKGILAKIIGATDMYQAATYLEALAQFVVRFRDPELLREFQRSKIPLSAPPPPA